MQCIKQQGAHLAHCKLLDAAFGNVLEDYLSNVSECLWSRLRKPAVKTLRAKFCSMFCQRKFVDTVKFTTRDELKNVTNCDTFLNDSVSKQQDKYRQKYNHRLNADDSMDVLFYVVDEIPKAAITRSGKYNESTSLEHEKVCRRAHDKTFGGRMRA